MHRIDDILCVLFLRTGTAASRSLANAKSPRAFVARGPTEKPCVLYRVGIWHLPLIKGLLLPFRVGLSKVRGLEFVVGRRDALDGAPFACDTGLWNPGPLCPFRTFDWTNASRLEDLAAREGNDKIHRSRAQKGWCGGPQVQNALHLRYVFS